MSLSLNVRILAESFYTVYKLTKYQCHCPFHCWICLLDIRRRKFVALKGVINRRKIISAALIRGRRSFKKIDLKCGAHSGAALNWGRRSNE
jgi:hypothetical protein